MIFDQTKVAGRQLPPSLIQYGGQTKMSQQMTPTFFLHAGNVLIGYQVKPSILGSAHST